jgi:hypothetical protein
MLSPSNQPIALLPQDRELMAVLGCSEAEYRQFIRACNRKSGLRPSEPTCVFGIDDVIILLVIGIVLNLAAALLFRPKTPGRPAEIRQTSQQGQNVVGRSEFAPKAGFDSLQNVVELGSTIPLVYANRETINGVTYGGVRVNTNLLWSQMISQGGSQMLRAVCLIGEATLSSIDPAQFAFGDNLLGGYDLSTANSTSSRGTFYVSQDGGRIGSADRVAGRSAANDPGNSENAGALDVFAIPGLNGQWTNDFCYSFKPSTQTQFGIYQLIGNGLAFRVNPSLRPAVVVKSEPSGKQDTRISCNSDGVAIAQRNKYNTLFSSRSGFTHRNGIPTSGVTNLQVGDTLIYSLSSNSDARTIFLGVQEGPDHRETCSDVAQTVSGRQRGWDDALSVGDLYKFGSALMICESRSPQDEIFKSEVDQDPIGGGQNISVTFRVVKAGLASLNGTEAKSTATATSHLFKVAMASFALPRSSQVVELGFRSTLGIRISGICNFRDSLSQAEIDGRACTYFNGRVYAPGQSLELSTYQSGSFSGSEIRYSFFKLGYRIAGSSEDYTYLNHCFGVRSITQQAVYNFIRLQMPTMQRWEFRVEPLSGWEIRNNIATGTLEVLDARISGYRTVTSGTGADTVTATYSGEPVARIPETFRIAATKDKGLGVALADSDDYADTWGKLAEAFVFEELSSSARSPEHELVYVNLLAPNPNVPNYDHMALVGMNLRSSTEFSQLNQLSVYVNQGIAGGIHTFPEVLQDLLTNDRYGVGTVLSSEQVDVTSFAECAQWTRDRRYFFDGALDKPLNLRQWGSQTAGYFLLDLVIKGGRFALQPAVYFDRPEPITNLYTAGNILEGSFEFAYAESQGRTPNRISVKWRQEKASTDISARGLFPVIREVSVREAGTPVDAPLEAIDLTDFCTSERHAIDVAKYLCRGRRLITHSVRFKTIPTEAVLEVGRCFKLGLETVAYSQPNNGAIDSTGKVVTTEPLADGTYDVLLWRGTSGKVLEEVSLSIVDQRCPAYAGSVFCLKQSTSEVRAYKVQSLGFDEDGNVQVEALYFPLLDNGYSALVDGWEAAGNWIIEGAVGISEDSGTTTSSFEGVSIIGPSTITTGAAAIYTTLVSGGNNTYTYSWSGADVTFGSPGSANTTVTATSSGSKTIICTVTSGAVIRTKSKTILATSATTPPVIGTVSLTGDTTATINTARNYTLEYTSKPAATTAGSFVVGHSYQIVTSGTTNFTTIGASNSNIGTVFTATGVGTGTGTADELGTAFFAWNWSSTTPDASASVSNSGTPRAKVTFTAVGVYTLTGSISSPTASDGPTKTASIVVTVT